MVIDLRRCIGCNACTAACKAEHGTPPGVLYSRVLVKEVGSFPAVKKLFVPLLCNHCRNAPCAQVCPTGATYKREDGIVLVDHDKCMGCRACYVACPYQNRFYLDGGVLAEGYFAGVLTPFEQAAYAEFCEGTVVKCTFCAHRIERGLLPACVLTCTTEARVFGDPDDPTSEVSRLVREEQATALLPERGTEPSVFYILPAGLALEPAEKGGGSGEAKEPRP
jgi:molybdopterin-containing oxidoreductase family iron-sulfur binding subunit